MEPVSVRLDALLWINSISNVDRMLMGSLLNTDIEIKSCIIPLDACGLQLYSNVLLRECSGHRI